MAGASQVRRCAVCGTETAYGSMGCACYAMCATDIAYAATPQEADVQVAAYYCDSACYCTAISYGAMGCA
eukprot:698700-Rhodomonas_salina.1